MSCWLSICPDKCASFLNLTNINGFGPITKNSYNHRNIFDKYGFVKFLYCFRSPNEKLILYISNTTYPLPYSALSIKRHSEEIMNSDTGFWIFFSVVSFVHIIIFYSKKTRVLKSRVIIYCCIETFIRLMAYYESVSR